MQRERSVLFVDDEPKTLKNVARLLAGEFTVATATSADEAIVHLESHADDTAVIVSDQRMPGRTGADLLGEVRERWPAPIRILATAYADLDATVQAINDGQVWHYISKPWEPDQLRITLRRALDFYELLEERDTLLREKLSTWQRIVLTDRVRSLGVIGAALSPSLRNAAAAVQAYFHQARALDALSRSAQPSHLDPWILAREESDRVRSTVRAVTAHTGAPVSGLDAAVDIGRLLDGAADLIHARTGHRPLVDVASDAASVQANAPLAEQLCGVLGERLASLAPGEQLRLSAAGGEAVNGTPAIRLRFAGEGPTWPAEAAASLFEDLDGGADSAHGSELLTAFLIVHHHGGSLQINTGPPAGPGFDVLLPLDPTAASVSEAGEDLVDTLAAYFEQVDATGG